MKAVKPRCGKRMKRDRICGRPAGHQRQCKSVESLEYASTCNVKFRADNGDYILQDRRQFYRSIRGRAYTLVNGAKQRAEAKGLPFSLTVDWAEVNIRLALEAGCPLLGIPITMDADISNPPGSPSIDRRDPSKGYVQDNCWIISRQANTMKNSATREELLTFANNAIKIFGSSD